MKIKSHKLTLLILAILATLLAACQVQIGGGIPVNGSGNIVTESYEISSFTEVEFSGFGELTLTQGERAGLTITTDDNLLEYLTVENSGQTLKLGFKPNASFKPSDTIRFDLVVTDISRIDVDGAGEVSSSKLVADELTINFDGAGSLAIDDLEAATLDMALRGAGSVEIGGTVESQTILLDGLGQVNLANLASTSADVTLEGLGSINVWVTDSLDAKIDGAGTIEYKGSPTVNETVDGLGSVKRTDG